MNNQCIYRYNCCHNHVNGKHLPDVSTESLFPQREETEREETEREETEREETEREETGKQSFSTQKKGRGCPIRSLNDNCPHRKKGHRYEYARNKVYCENYSNPTCKRGHSKIFREAFSCGHVEGERCINQNSHYLSKNREARESLKVIVKSLLVLASTKPQTEDRLSGWEYGFLHGAFQRLEQL
uniref:Uncharacterized protein n=1 Tax=Lobelia muscoides TaxID=2010895 RepID=A0A1Z2R0H2_9ASTR|nr:hypothetical protein Lo_mus1Pt0118 [Lobelia muscoides]ASA37198.1 hypothetical protein Lo_mus1Pt0118 [Lobelia muscoides]